MKILNVNDNAEARAAIRNTLEECGFSVIEAADGEEAVAIALSEGPDVIISDILLEKMDGYEFLRQVRRSESIRDTRFIFYSELYHSSQGTQLARKLGADAFIAKNRNTDNFCSHLKAVLNNKDIDRSIDNSLLENDVNFLREYKNVVSAILKSQAKVIDQAKNKIFQEQVNYKNLFNSIQDVIIVFDLDENIIDANQPALRDVFGFEVDDIVGSKFSRLFQSEDEYLTANTFFYKEQNTVVWKFVETVLRKKDGSFFNGELFPYHLNDQFGNVVASIAIVRDISKRKNVETLLSHVFESMGEGMAIVGRDYRIVEANSAYCQMFDMPKEKVIGSRCYEVSHKHDRPCDSHSAECPAVHSFGTGEISIVVHKHENPDGGYSYHENKTFPMKNELGEVYSVIEIFNDVTEKILLEDQLRHAQKMEAVGTLTGGIAHDFNNILSVIVGHGSLMQMKMDQDHPFAKSVSNIMQASEKATSLTQRLLTFSRKQALNAERCHLNEVLSGLENFLRKMIPESNPLEIYLSEAQLVVEIDQAQFEQVIMNIVINSSHAITDHGKITILTSLQEIDKSFIRHKGFGVPGEYAVLTIRDDGKGMSNEILSRIYEPFFTTKEVGQGTGLGLSVAYGIMKQHNGYIDCESEEGDGSIFNIYLPVSDEKIDEIESVSVAAAKGTETILVAEDDENVRFLLKEILNEAGYRVEASPDGLEAFEIFKAAPDKFDLVILDVVMPNMNGKDALDAMRKIRKDLKVIFISGYTNEIIESKGIVEKEYKYLQKPISPNHFLNEIRTTLDD